MFRQTTLEFQTRGRGSYDVTDSVQEFTGGQGITTGLAHLFLQHTSASLMLCENADPEVRRDLERFLLRLVPDGDPLFRHTAEGDDDMPAHVRTVLTQSELTLPVADGRCVLGTWQGIYLYEHRQRAHLRRLTVTLQGE